MPTFAHHANGNVNTRNRCLGLGPLGSATVVGSVGKAEAAVFFISAAPADSPVGNNGTPALTACRSNRRFLKAVQTCRSNGALKRGSSVGGLGVLATANRAEKPLFLRGATPCKLSDHENWRETHGVSTDATDRRSNDLRQKFPNLGCFSVFLLLLARAGLKNQHRRYGSRANEQREGD